MPNSGRLGAMGQQLERHRCCLAGAIAVIALSLVVALWHPDRVNPAGWEQVGRFMAASLHPDLSPDLLRLTLRASATTLAYALCGTSLSLGLGAIGGLLCSEIWWIACRPHRSCAPIVWLLRTSLALPRALHEVLWGLLFVNLWGLDPLTAVLAIAMPFGAITAKVFAEQLDETPRQPVLALVHSGVSPLSACLYGLLPLARGQLLSYGCYRLECALRSAAVLGIIGAGGLGYEIWLSLQSLKYEQLWTFFWALVLLNGAVDWLSAQLRRPPAGGWAIGRWLGGLLAIGLSFHWVGANFSHLWSPATGQRWHAMVQMSWPPDGSMLPALGGLTYETLAMSILATAIAALGGVLLAVPAAYLPPAPAPSPRQALVAALRLLVARLVLLVCRAIPAPIWALVVVFVLFPGILPGAVALGIHNLGILGRLKAETIEQLDPRPRQALLALGASPLSSLFYGILPIAAPQFLAYDLYRWEVCLRETVVVGLVGSGGLGQLLTEQLSSFDYRSVIVTLGCFWALTAAVDAVSTVSRRLLR